MIVLTPLLMSDDDDDDSDDETKLCSPPYYNTSDDEMSEIDEEDEQFDLMWEGDRTYNSLLGTCGECVMDRDETPEDPNGFKARLMPCKRHHKHWETFEDFREWRNSIYYPEIADIDYPCFAPQNAHARHLYLPRIPLEQVAYRFWLVFATLMHYNFLRDFQNHKIRSGAEATCWFSEKEELKSIGFHGPWHWKHEGWVRNPCLGYFHKNGCYGPWIPDELRFHTPDEWEKSDFCKHWMLPENYKVPVY